MYTNFLTLNNGVNIPQFGLGTWFIEDGKAADAVRRRQRKHGEQYAAAASVLRGFLHSLLSLISGCPRSGYATARPVPVS